MDLDTMKTIIIDSLKQDDRIDSVSDDVEVTYDKNQRGILVEQNDGMEYTIMVIEE